MRREEFTFKDLMGMDIYTYKWLPDEGMNIKACVQIAHGMAETAARYERFAKVLTDSGYVVYANDHKGHGKTAKTLENVGNTGHEGFEWMIKNMYQLNGIINKENPGIPVFLFGHSMGSLLAQRYIALYGEGLKGVILSGTSGKQGIMLDIGISIARREMRKRGEKYRSEKLNDMTFGSYNDAFKPVRTEFDWLSRDEKEVDKYVEDPFCGGVFTAKFFYDFFMMIKETHKPETMMKIPKELPVYLFSGEKDPVGKKCKSVLGLIKIYKKLGLKDVSYKFYKDGRHEMLNEINRDEVMDDVVKWLDAH